MNILIIPDVHLKPWMFDRASEIMNSEFSWGKIDKAVCLGDLADDFGQIRNLGLYENTFDTAIEFARTFPKTLWCYGNHEIAYMGDNMYQTGYSELARPIVRGKLSELQHVASDSNIGIVHVVDNIMFSHAGLERSFVQQYVKSKRGYYNTDAVIQSINHAHISDLWQNNSPIWFRPQHPTEMKTYRPKSILQVIGHTPVVSTTQYFNFLMCDTFSTYPNKTPYGDQKFTILDTNTHWFITL